jgi:hypothetical protein
MKQSINNLKQKKKKLHKMKLEKFLKKNKKILFHEISFKADIY